MRQKSTRSKEPAEKTVRDIRRRTRKQYSAEAKIRIVLEELRGEDSIAALCRREGIATSPQPAQNTLTGAWGTLRQNSGSWPKKIRAPLRRSLRSRSSELTIFARS